VQITIADTNSWSEPIVISTKELQLIRGGAELTIGFCTLSLPIKFVEVLVVVVSIQVEELEKPITPKLVPLAIPKIGVGA